MSTQTNIANVAAEVNAALGQLAHNQLTSETFEAYMYAGHAIFTVSNAQTGARMTFKVKESKKNANRFFVTGSLLGDGDASYVKLGSIYHGRSWNGVAKADQFFIDENCPETETSVSIRAVRFLMKHNTNISAFPHAVVQMKDNCVRCGRKLTTPESIESRMGAECARREHAAGIVPAGQQRTVNQRPNRRRAV